MTDADFDDYTVMFSHVLSTMGFDVVAQYNCFEPPYCADTGWPLKLPDLEWRANTVLLLHFQDFVTATSHGILELNRVEQHYGDRSDRVIVTHWPHALSRYYDGAINLIEFASHEWQVIRNLRAQESVWQAKITKPKTRAWQCLNGRKCDHRQRVASILQHWPNGVLSLGMSVPLPDWAYDTYPGTENEQNWLRLLPVYSECAVNIVTETQYDTAPGIITEKTTMALLACQIPIVVGYAGIVQDCEELGFDMFRDLVDTSYDSLANNRRAEAALWLNEDLIQGRIDLGPYQARLQQQQQFVLSDYTARMELTFRLACQELALRLL
jgi:hypothetical protein